MYPKVKSNEREAGRTTLRKTIGSGFCGTQTNLTKKTPPAQSTIQRREKTKLPGIHRREKKDGFNSLLTKTAF